MMRIMTLTMTVVIALGVGGCEHLGLLSSSATGSFQKPTMKFIRLDSVDVTFEKVTLKFFFEITNPNTAQIALAGYDAKLGLEGIYFLDSKSDGEIILPGQQSTEVVIPMTLTFKEAFAAYRALASADDIGYSLQGGFRLRGIILDEVRLPIGVSGRFPIPRAPSITLKHIRLKDSSLIDGVNLEVQFEIENPNILSLTVDESAFDLVVNRLEIGRCSLPKTTIKSKDQGKVTISLEVQAASVVRALLMALTEDQIDYAIRGEVGINLGSFPPWKYHSQFEGKIENKK